MALESGVLEIQTSFRNSDKF